jgi:hypothetical protein
MNSLGPRNVLSHFSLQPDEIHFFGLVKVGIDRRDTGNSFPFRELSRNEGQEHRSRIR